MAPSSLSLSCLCFPLFRAAIELAEAGSELVRVTVNVPAAAAAVPEIKRRMLNGLDARVRVIVHPDVDAVGVAVGLGGARPLAEALVAHEQ